MIKTRLALTLPDFVGLLHGALSRGRHGVRRLWLQRHSCPARLRKANGDGLLRRAHPVLALADVVNLFADEFSGRSRGRLALA